MMMYFDLKRKIQDMMTSRSTLLWLEGAKHDQVSAAQIKAGKLVLSLENGTLRIIPFERYAVTSVGVQFWNRGRPGVLYRWDLHNLVKNQPAWVPPEDDPTPPHQAA